MSIAKNFLWAGALLVSAAALATTTGLAYRDTTLVIGAAAETERAAYLVEYLNAVSSSLFDVEHWADDYLKTHQPASLASYYIAANELKSKLPAFDTVKPVSSTVASGMYRLRGLVENELERLHRAVETVTTGGSAVPESDVPSVMQEFEEKQLHDQIAAIRADLRAEERARNERILQIHLHNRLKHLFGALAGVAAALVVLFLLRRELVFRQRSAIQATFHGDWMKAVVHGIGEAVVVTDREGTIRMLNSSAERLSGFGKEEATGQNLLDLLKLHDEATGERLSDLLNGFKADGGKIRQQRNLILQRRDGSKLTVESKTTLLSDSPYEDVVVLLRDVTDSRKTAMELSRASVEVARHANSILEAERTLKTILENAPIGIFVTGSAPEYRIIAASRQVQAWIGDVEDTPAHEAYRKLLPDGREPPLDVLPLNRVMVWGQGVRDERWLIERKNKPRLEMLVNVAPVRDADGSIVGAVHCWVDLTEKQKLDHVLRIMQSRLRVLLEADVIGLILHFDAAGKVTEANKVFLEMLGFDETDLAEGKINLAEQTPSEFKELDERAFAEIEKKGSCTPYEKEFFCKDSSKRLSVIVGYAKVADFEGEYVGFALDVSVRKKLERQLRQQAQELLVADQRKNVFLAMLAHELRNPLAPLRNAVHLLMIEDGKNPNAFSVLLPMMQRQVDQLVNLVDDLLDAARISQGKIVLDFRFVDLIYALRAAIESVGPLVRERNHDLKLIAPPHPLIVRGDITRLTQIFTNILHNAAKYTEKSGRIEIALVSDNVFAEVRIRDNGKGMTSDFLPHIFEPFIQDDQSLARSEGGLGIGLALAQKLCDLHGGTISVTSEGLGKGSEFVVRLPLATAPESSVPHPALPAPQPGQSKRVLVVDDNGDLARSTAALLEIWGHQTRIVHEGHAAMEAVQDFRPDVVLLDIGLPGMDGFEIARSIRSSTNASELPLVAISGYSQKQDYARGLQVGFNAYLVKPVQPDALKVLLDQIPPHRWPD